MCIWLHHYDLYIIVDGWSNGSGRSYVVEDELELTEGSSAAAAERNMEIVITAKNPLLLNISLSLPPP